MVLLSPFENNSERMVMRKAIVAMSVIVVSAAISLSADTPAWPSDFWTQVSNHVEAVAPSGTQIGTSNCLMAADSTVKGLVSAAYGTVEEPFSTQYPGYGYSADTLLNTRPVGAMMILR